MPWPVFVDDGCVPVIRLQVAAFGEFQCAAAEVVVDFAGVDTPHVDGVAELFFTLFVVVVVVEFLHWLP